MSKLRLAMACWNYDRTRALLEDRIPVDGIDLTYINIPAMTAPALCLRTAFPSTELT